MSTASVEVEVIGRRKAHFWKPFNDWWREVLANTGKRPTADDVYMWYSAFAREIWGTDRVPTLDEARVHAKSLRSVDDVKSYFRKYRAKRISQSDSHGDSERDDHGLNVDIGRCSKKDSLSVKSAGNLPHGMMPMHSFTPETDSSKRKRLVSSIQYHQKCLDSTMLRCKAEHALDSTQVPSVRTILLDGQLQWADSTICKHDVSSLFFCSEERKALSKLGAPSPLQMPNHSSRQVLANQSLQTPAFRGVVQDSTRSKPGYHSQTSPCLTGTEGSSGFNPSCNGRQTAERPAISDADQLSSAKLDLALCCNMHLQTPVSMQSLASDHGTPMEAPFKVKTEHSVEVPFKPKAGRWCEMSVLKPPLSASSLKQPALTPARLASQPVCTVAAPEHTPSQCAHHPNVSAQTSSQSSYNPAVLACTFSPPYVNHSWPAQNAPASTLNPVSSSQAPVPHRSFTPGCKAHISPAFALNMLLPGPYAAAQSSFINPLSPAPSSSQSQFDLAVPAHNLPLSSSHLVLPLQSSSMPTLSTPKPAHCPSQSSLILAIPAHVPTSESRFADSTTPGNCEALKPLPTTREGIHAPSCFSKKDPPPPSLSVPLIASPQSCPSAIKNCLCSQGTDASLGWSASFYLRQHEYGMPPGCAPNCAPALTLPPSFIYSHTKLDDYQLVDESFNVTDLLNMLLDGSPGARSPSTCAASSFSNDIASRELFSDTSSPQVLLPCSPKQSDNVCHQPGSNVLHVMMQSSHSADPLRGLPNHSTHILGHGHHLGGISVPTSTAWMQEQYPPVDSKGLFSSSSMMQLSPETCLMNPWEAGPVILHQPFQERQQAMSCVTTGTSTPVPLTQAQKQGPHSSRHGTPQPRILPSWLSCGSNPQAAPCSHAGYVQDCDGKGAMLLAALRFSAAGGEGGHPLLNSAHPLPPELHNISCKRAGSNHGSKVGVTATAGSWLNDCFQLQDNVGDIACDSPITKMLRETQHMWAHDPELVTGLSATSATTLLPAH
ncbi:hypothetical protein CEUSTIGMA_g175.t1 [Chlamydomonas eustigma]|uniref:Uncharacterized protein n=1 Tax=Chlamydomonas eustigma TaxID=1157962 RepID=A0A250WPU4_9CHLO|nr:hypothetical protein CEUSTIGMA_g175.t1 [Chlamydomonas eustigma]|eukprot:GAX72719.1 hypothetical protein CEUSTIGMA_g175.t1 [Chlamydomonas eustigma]